MESDKIEFEKYKEGELRQIRKLKSNYVQQANSGTLKITSKKDVDEVKKLKQEVLKIQEELKLKENNNKLLIDSLKKQLIDAKITIESLSTKEAQIGATRDNRLKNATNNVKKSKSILLDNSLAKSKSPIRKRNEIHQNQISSKIDSIKNDKSKKFEFLSDELDQEVNSEKYQNEYYEKNTNPYSHIKSKVRTDISTGKTGIYGKKLSNDSYSKIKKLNEKVIKLNNNINNLKFPKNLHNSSDNSNINNNENSPVNSKKNLKFLNNKNEFTIKNPQIDNLFNNAANLKDINKSKIEKINHLQKELIERSSNFEQSELNKDNYAIEETKPINSTSNNYSLNTYEKKNIDFMNFNKNEKLIYHDQLKKYSLYFPSQYQVVKKMIRKEKLSDGKIINFYEKDIREVIFPSGVQKEIHSDGYQLVKFPNNDIKQLFPDGRMIYFFNESKTVQSTIPIEKLQVFKFSNGQIERHYDNGEKQILYSDGTVKLINKYGYEETIGISTPSSS